MEVYTRFRKDFEHRLDILSDPEAAFGPPPPDDYIVPVFNLVDEVRFVGPPNVGDEVKVAAERLQDYMNSPSAESHARYQATAAAQDGVASSMRHALGFSTFGELSG
ncbi:hypothetical protein [Ornithinimicrobium sp. Y1694]|uniref:hypothetical protein n=1 Tax=Ornithinimicrobium sp. Y1694 TaxID=3418590 RepID=UPI003CF00D43